MHDAAAANIVHMIIAGVRVKFVVFVFKERSVSAEKAGVVAQNISLRSIFLRSSSGNAICTGRCVQLRQDRFCDQTMRSIFIFIICLPLHSFKTIDTKSYYLKDVQFEINSDAIGQSQTKDLETIVQTIKEMMAERKVKTFTLWINGNSDSSENNVKRLSINRAKNVCKKLISLGLAGGTLITKGHGTKRPVTNSSTLDEKEKNARVDFQIKME